MTTPPLPNALTPEEWAASCSGSPNSAWVSEDGSFWLTTPNGERWVVKRRHAHAAHALHGQPFGFTRDDIAFLRDIPKMVEDRTMTDEDERRAASLAARIDALLPPLDASSLQP